jgi:hypothetical protein
MTHIIDDDTPVPAPTFFERHSTLIVWVVGTIAAVLLAYGDLRVTDTAIAKEIDTVREGNSADHTAIKSQLDRIEGKIQSVEEFLREHDKQDIPIKK